MSDDTITRTNGHTYPSNYAPPGKDSDLDKVWEVLDHIKPGVIPSHVRAYLAGHFVGLISRIRNEEQNNVRKE